MALLGLMTKAVVGAAALVQPESRGLQLRAVVVTTGQAVERVLAVIRLSFAVVATSVILKTTMLVVMVVVEQSASSGRAVQDHSHQHERQTNKHGTLHTN
jgi:hypothetical protein